ncbi:unnamed protein product [Penicillium camemberti]|uniref:Str. FM013 n=1 Tax=Penicillium camemberti (strain FM 013) TaxID=1429867 RepID=A0A0G4PF88_PENC3|nr:unnamed protein product [Penicillium camemberti]
MECENEDEDMALLPARWGSVLVVGSVGHCSFTSGDVEEPHEDQRYPKCGGNWCILTIYKANEVWITAG